jgi:thiamine-monophosphate kinase
VNGARTGRGGGGHGGLLCVGDLGERGLIGRLAGRVGRGRGVVRGIGDDCAVVRVHGSAWDWLLTTDPVIEGVHFLRDAPGRRVGHKAAGRVISDIAAMGGEPLYVLFDLVAPAGAPVGRIEDIYRGATAVCARHGAAIIGGDVARGPRLELHAFAVGRVERGRAVLRSGARPGDVIHVTGRLGGSRLGRHLTFEPRVAAGRWIARGGWATAMMDVSDGLASDLRRILEESRVGADLDAARIPVSSAARRLRDGRSALDHALGDGEDFELLFTVPAARTAAFSRAWRRAFPGLPATAIGTITPARGVLTLKTEGTARPVGRGYEHFVT